MVAKMLYSMHNCSGGRTTNLNNSARINVNNSIHLTRCKGGFMLHPAKPYFRLSLRTEVEIGIRENVGCFRPSSDQSSYEWSLAILLSGITFYFLFCLESFSLSAHVPTTLTMNGVVQSFSFRNHFHFSKNSRLECTEIWKCASSAFNTSVFCLT